MTPLLALALSMALVVGLIIWLRIHAFLALLVGAVFVALVTPSVPLADAATLVASEFGVLAGRIGIIIALASFVGLGLQQSGGAARIGAFFLSLTGRERAQYAMWANGYVLSIPVFFDTVFYLLTPLIKAMHARARWGYQWYLMAAAAGGAATHVFVPPTPGPLAAATQLNVDLGLMIVMGMAVALVGSAGGMLYAGWAFRHWPNAAARVRHEIEQQPLPAEASSAGAHQPGLLLSFLPIVLPVVLIAGRTATAALKLTGPLAATLSFIGDPNVALFLAAIATMVLLVRAKGISVPAMAPLAEEAFAAAGTIILITAAGGAYGSMLAKAQIASSLTATASTLGLPLLVLAYLLAVLLKFAQGSSTVAIITTAGVLQATYAGADPLSLPHPVYAALAAAGGSLVGSWMNDSGFWVISKMGGLDTMETVRLWSFTAAITGTCGFLAVLLLNLLVPLR
jgi:GntP family gluconate:H+ symporter